MNSSNILLNKRIFFKNQGKSEEFLMYPDFFYTVSRKSEIVPSLTGESEIVYAVSAKFEVANKPPNKYPNKYPTSAGQVQDKYRTSTGQVAY